MNWRSLVSEATTLPSELQSLPYMRQQFCVFLEARPANAIFSSYFVLLIHCHIIKGACFVYHLSAGFKELFDIRKV